MSAPLVNAFNARVSLPAPTGPTATSLPDDILREIFLHFVCKFSGPESFDLALHGANEWRLFGETNASRAIRPFLLATVCRRWRYIALDTAELWTWISLGDQPRGTLICNQEYLDTLLRRSKRATLDVHMNVLGPVSGEAWVTAGDGICTSLASVCDRWRTLSLTVPVLQISPACAALLSCNTPRLEYLDFRFIEEPGDEQAFPTEERHQGPVSVALELQKIRSICVSQASLPVVRTALHSLVSLCLSMAKVQLDAFWHVLHCSPNLQLLRIGSTYKITNVYWSPPSRLRLSHLTELVMLGCDSCITSMFAQHFEFPRLEKLYTEDVEDLELAALLPSARESLISLGFADNGAIRPTLIPVISMLPHVRELWFGPCDTIPDPAFFAAMETGALFPTLERLFLVCGWFVWEYDPAEPGGRWARERASEAQRSAKALLSFVKSRNSRDATEIAQNTAPPRLQFVQIDGQIDAAFRCEMEKLVSVRIV